MVGCRFVTVTAFVCWYIQKELLIIPWLRLEKCQMLKNPLYEVKYMYLKIESENIAH